MMTTKMIHPRLDITVAEFNQRYHDNLESVSSIAKSLGTNHSLLKRHAQKAGIRFRTPEEFAAIRHRYVKKRYSVNHALFETWSPEMAWVLGLIASDGSISRWQVQLGMKDADAIEKAHSITEYTGPLSYPSDGRTVLIITSIELIRALAKHGLGPRKSLTIQYPEMPDDMHRHFIRGHFDGDGHICQSRKPSQNMPFIEAAITCGSKDFSHELHRQLTLVGIKPSINKRQREGGWQVNPIWRVRMSSHRVVRFYHFLYDDVSPSMSLQRKYDKMTQCVQARLKHLRGDGIQPAICGHGSITFQRNFWKGKSRICKVEPCNESVHAKGFCETHYHADYRQRRKPRRKS